MIPYTNPTWWCDEPKGPTFQKAGQGPLLKLLNGKPSPERYAQNTGFTVNGTAGGSGGDFTGNPSRGDGRAGRPSRTAAPSPDDRARGRNEDRGPRRRVGGDRQLLRRPPRPRGRILGGRPRRRGSAADSVPDARGGVQGVAEVAGGGGGPGKATPGGVEASRAARYTGRSHHRRSDYHFYHFSPRLPR